MDNNSFDFMKEAFAAPLGDFIASIGKGVGEAQAALDAGSLEQTLSIYNGDTSEDQDEKILKLFREIGYQPTFYVLPKTTAKAKITMAISQRNHSSLNSPYKNFGTKMYITPTNATHNNTYNLDVNACAEIQFDIVPVPPSETSLVRIVPNISGKSLRDAITILDQYQINYSYDEDTISESTLIVIKGFQDKEDSIVVPGETIMGPNDILNLVKKEY